MKPTILLASSLIAAACLWAGIKDKQQVAFGYPSEPAFTANRQVDAVQEASEATFKRNVLKAKKPVLVDFYATWCGPCRRMAPVIESVSKSYSGKIAVIKVDVDKNPRLAAEYDIQSIPTIKLFKNGKVIDEAVGVTSVAELHDKIDRATKSRRFENCSNAVQPQTDQTAVERDIYFEEP